MFVLFFLALFNIQTNNQSADTATSLSACQRALCVTRVLGADVANPMQHPVTAELQAPLQASACVHRSVASPGPAHYADTGLDRHLASIVKAKCLA